MVKNIQCNFMSKRSKIDYEKIEELLEVLLAQDVISNWWLQTPGQYSVNDRSLYLYPKSQKYFYPENREWGEYEDLENFLCLAFEK